MKVSNAHLLFSSLLALGAVHNHLVRKKLRMKVALIVETGETKCVIVHTSITCCTCAINITTILVLNTFYMYMPYKYITSFITFIAFHTFSKTPSITTKR